ncbi:TIGR02530 family flagellar biosynthesis protein [Salimicrobium salexigens]|uniref:Flagellar operon protein n=1 Tax=Salimicrobium salexigens TaxID=908941 RepID=A0ABY1KPW8_9BACI|nr:TIGR02530 family flagellar biosynthesis protein [Salimicrobium salexigens]SIS63294.1 flagellar operon protein [Salimicrobium salexigens]
MEPKIHRSYHPMPLDVNRERSKPKETDRSFQEVMGQQLTLSKHARQRLEERNIEIPSEQWNKIGEKLTEAKRKGVRDSLVLTKEAVLVVNTNSNTVVTAMDKQSANSRLFTNIDGTIIM